MSMCKLHLLRVAEALALCDTGRHGILTTRDAAMLTRVCSLLCSHYHRVSDMRLYSSWMFAGYEIVGSV